MEWSRRLFIEKALLGASTGTAFVYCPRPLADNQRTLHAFKNNLLLLEWLLRTPFANQVEAHVYRHPI